MDFSKLLLECWRHVNDLDWSNDDFSARKAFVCSVFSEIAYEHIADFELKSSKRVKVVPCDRYQELIQRGQAVDVRTLLLSADFDDVFVIETERAIVVGVRRPKVVFVAVRGTVLTHVPDLYVDGKAMRKRVGDRRVGAKVHRGFLRAMSRCLPELSDELRNSLEADVPVIVAGHSLGAAMGAMLHAGWGGGPAMDWGAADPTAGVNPLRLVPGPRSTRSCYGFGMPRYGNRSAVTRFRAPHAICNERDLVPTVPPRWLGYANYENAYEIDGFHLAPTLRRETANAATRAWRLITLKGLFGHRVRLYRERMQKTVEAGFS